MYQGKPILHSLGQAVFDDRRADRGKRFKEGLLARIAVENKKVKSISLVPTWRDDENSLRLEDPNHGKGKELLGVLKSVNEGGAGLEVKGREIMVSGVK
jgi:hypothetical protein